MPLPFAKTQVYHHSTHTPLIVRWPGVTEAGAVDDRHMVSAVDLLPTLLEVVGAEPPEDLDGRSFASLLEGQRQTGREMIFKDYNENAGASRDPMRAVQTEQYLYIFNPWSNGHRVMATATTGTATYRRMAELAKGDPTMAARHDLYRHRVVEELYHVADDPDCLKNLVDDPAHADALNEMRDALENWMVETGDPMLEVFRQRDDPAAREAFVRHQEKEAEARRAARRKARQKAKRGGRKAKRK
jgi:N-sulfoglucosamine sulfohydrolase